MFKNDDKANEGKITMTIQDRSKYFKGLLILVKRDNKINKYEKELVFQVGRTLGFDKEFCEETINTLLINDNIAEEPIKFSQPEIAKLFVKDGLKIANTGQTVNNKEISWLSTVAIENKLDSVWVEEQITSLSSAAISSDKLIFEISNLI